MAIRFNEIVKSGFSRRRPFALSVLALAAVLAVALLLAPSRSGEGQAAAPKVEHVILLHGWHSSPGWWVIAELQYRAAGFDVHALQLPRDGTQDGDTTANADYVERYIEDRGLTNVQVDGHSLGGVLVYELVRVRRNAAIVSAVTRDSNVQDPVGYDGTICSWWLPVLVGSTIIPDQCEDSSVRQAIMEAAPADVPVLNLSSNDQEQPDVMCHRRYDIWHNNFLFNLNVTNDAVAWAQGENPCSSPPEAVPCPWWLGMWGLC